jgi:hypothetical protein
MDVAAPLRGARPKMDRAPRVALGSPWAILMRSLRDLRRISKLEDGFHKWI